jgi:small subunit ribosomal protein S3
MFRRAMKRAVMSTMRSGALGMKVRLSGASTAQSPARKSRARGRVPLHTFRADIDYATAEARTTYGGDRHQVWIFKGEVFDKVPEVVERTAEAAAPATPVVAPATGELPAAV